MDRQIEAPRREELQAFTAAAAEAARRAGAVLEEWQERFQVREKARFDLVTEADHAAQETIERCLEERFPEHAFLGEESTLEARQAALRSRAPVWIVDPLDGTTNYVHRCPVFAVSIGLAWAGECLAGVVYDPNRQELFEAFRGGGARLNGQALRTSAVGSLDQALVSAGFPPDLQGQERALAAWHRLSVCTQSLRRTGSTALNLAYVAAGRHDGFWTHQAHPWDAAAGIVLVREAGGRVTNLEGGEHDFGRLDVAASNGPLHPALLQGFRGTLGHPQANCADPAASKNSSGSSFSA